MINFKDGKQVFAAPLAGVSDVAYRSIVKRMGADFTFTEMVASEGLIRNSKKTFQLLQKYPNENNVGSQLFGTKPEVLADAAEILQDQGFSSIDLNCGCPVHKIVNKCGGAALLKDLPLLEKIIVTVVKRISIPFSIKFRSGWNSKSLNYLEVGKIAEGAGAAYVALHARTQEEFFQPEVHLEHIGELKSELSIPVIGNGGIKSAQDALSMIEKTDCDGIMIASGSLGNPFLFREIKTLLQTGKKAEPPTTLEKIQVCLEHVKKICGFCGESAGIKRSRKLLGWYYRHLTGRSKIDQRLFQVDTYAEVELYLNEFLESSTEDTAKNE